MTHPLIHYSMLKNNNHKPNHIKLLRNNRSNVRRCIFTRAVSNSLSVRARFLGV